MDFNPKGFVAAEVTKSESYRDAGLKLTEYKGEYIIYEVGGVFSMFTPLEPGSRLLKLQDKDIKEYKDLDEIKQVIEHDNKISIEAQKRPDFYNLENESDTSLQESDHLGESMSADH